MKIISFITEAEIIRRILEHLGLWAEKPRKSGERAPPQGKKGTELFSSFPWPPRSS